MLLDFKVKNFRSIFEEQTFSMRPSIGAKNLAHTGSSYYPEALQVSAIYGPNGSGKSNFVNSMDVCRSMVRQSAKASSDILLPFDPCMTEPKAKHSSTKFELVFALIDTVWRYGFEYNSEKILTEWLYTRNYKPRSREICRFQRENGALTELHSSLKKYSRLLSEQTNANQLFLSKLDQNNDKITQPAYWWIVGYFRPMGTLDDFNRSITAAKCADQTDKDTLIAILNSIGMEIEDIQVEEEKGNIPEGFPSRINDEFEALLDNPYHPIMSYSKSEYTKYNVDFAIKSKMKNNVPMSIHEESTGTQNLFALAGPLIDTFQYGLTLVIDELNSSFHTDILKIIVELFYSNESNPRNAQLIFTSHDTAVMDILERDEVWFVEKPKLASSQLYSLSSFGPVNQGGARRQQAFGKRYLDGRYGALPDIHAIEAIKAIKHRLEQTERAKSAKRKAN